jgi:hypothetical protein
LRRNEVRFSEYVRANRGWHNARLNEGGFRVVVTLGRLAQTGVEDWLRANHWQSAGQDAFRSPTGRMIRLVHAPHPAARGQQPADAAEELRCALRGDNSAISVANAPHGDRPQQPISIGPDRLIEPLAASESCRRDWTGNDEKGKNTHHGAIPLNESPLNIRLAWRRSSTAEPRLVGCFRLDLIGLLNEKYLQEDSRPGHVRLKFHRGNTIYIGTGAGARALVVGAFDDP